jgi:hypothetical protein
VKDGSKVVDNVKDGSKVVDTDGCDVGKADCDNNDDCDVGEPDGSIDGDGPNKYEIVGNDDTNGTGVPKIVGHDFNDGSGVIDIVGIVEENESIFSIDDSIGNSW